MMHLSHSPSKKHVPMSGQHLACVHVQWRIKMAYKKLGENNHPLYNSLSFFNVLMNQPKKVVSSVTFPV